MAKHVENTKESRKRKKNNQKEPDEGFENRSDDEGADRESNSDGESRIGARSVSGFVY